MASRMNNFTGKEWLQNSFTIWRDLSKTEEERSTKHPALYPQELAEKLINIYTKDSGEVILDPFLGIGSTLMAAHKLGKQGIGLDLSNEFVNIAKERLEKQASDNNLIKFEPKFYCNDSRKLMDHVGLNSVDLVVTSPPYWNILNQKRTADGKKIRNYSESSEDLGNIDNYEDFLANLKEVFTQVYKALKPNKRCCSIVMDIRKKDKFYPLHEDQSRIMREIGFELEEYVIWDRQKEYNNMKTLGYPWVFRFNKVHEYICVYWKR
jgi:DNA modification methylase